MHDRHLPFGMKGMDSATFERFNRGFDEARLIERVGVYGHLYIHLVCDGKASIDGAGVVPQSSCSFNPIAPWLTCSLKGFSDARITFAEKAEIHGKRRPLRTFSSCAKVPGCTWWQCASSRGPGTAAEHGGHARHQRFFDLLRADKVNMTVDAARRNNHALAGDDLGGCADHDSTPG